ncbi:MAG: hypothetical protein Q8M92_01345, partial [Candidatus Subteraquimicrobiales bacterium]|nr:hypothetical protein [Candidatus Subteraquimicrobiales bacterium]
ARIIFINHWFNIGLIIDTKPVQAGWVSGYYRSDGTYVSGYYRSYPSRTSGLKWQDGYYKPSTGSWVDGHFKTYPDKHKWNNRKSLYGW